MGRTPAREEATGLTDEAAPRAAPSRSPTASVIELQGLAGNAAVTRLLRQVVDTPVAAKAHRALHSGDRGYDVYMVRIKLNVSGIDPPIPTGFLFDEVMQDAVQRFQRERELEVTGWMDEPTWDKLDRLTRGRSPDDERDFEALNLEITEANERFEKGDLKGARRIYDRLYRDRRVTVDMRRTITFRRAHIAQANADFAFAISLYNESLQLPWVSTQARRDTLQRIRECRGKLPPGPLESDLNKREIDPDTLPEPGPGGPHRMLKLGARGREVHLAKMKLNVAGADPSLFMSFAFDGEMEGAVRRFQTDRKLTVDGIIGQQTWAALDAVTAGRAPGDQADYDALGAKVMEAHARFDAGDLKTARKLYDELYADPRVTVDVRSLITFRRAHIAQAAGDFTGALSLYTEYLQLPQLDTENRRDALQRVRECQLEQPPGPLESDANKQPVDPNTLPAPGQGGKHRFLKLGASGNDVRLARMKLNVAGIDPPLDNGARFDAEMENAVRQFQRNHNLQVDGQMGQQTWAALDLVTAGRSPGDEAEFEDLAAHVTYAHELFDGGELEKAGKHYQQLYADRRVTADVRTLITFRLAHIAQAKGNFTKAISLYTEYLELFHLTNADRRDALQRIREARNAEPPGPLESDLNKLPDLPIL